MNWPDKHTWFFWIALVVFALLGAVLLHWPGNELSKALGHALIIAAVIAATVDPFLKTRFIKEFGRNVAKYLIGYDLPKQIQDKIHELMGTRIVRRNYEQRYKLIPEGDGKLKIEVEFQYDVENVSSSPENYPHAIAFEEHDNPEIHELQCHSSDLEATYFYGRSDIKLEQDVPGVVYANGKTIRIRPLDEGLTYRISGKFALRVPERYSDIISFAAPTIGVTVIVSCPEDFEFISPAAEVTSPRRWEYRRVYLRGEHIHVRWFKRGELNAQTHL